jgi:hypothetical protein
MSQNPANLAVRFLLELAALFALSYWGWMRHAGALRYVLVIGLPLLAGFIWGAFRVPGDASASGRAPVPVPGWLRLAFELALFGFAAWAFFDAGAAGAGWVFGAVAFVHYLLSYDRIGWLLKR